MRQPWPARLLGALLRGDGAEYLRGDLEEGWQRRLGGPGARRRQIADAARSVAAWWKPSAVARRRRSDPGGRRSGGLDEVRSAIRNVRRRPAFLALVVVTLGLGIGATTTIFGVVDAVLIRPLPYAEANRLVAAGITFPGREWEDRDAGLQHLAGVSMPNFQEWQDRARTVELIAAEPRSVLLPDVGSGPELAGSMDVTPGFLEVLGVGPALGRGFVPDDFAGRNGLVALITHASWMRRHGGDASIVGRPVSTAGGAIQVIGVLPPSFAPPEILSAGDVEFWLPLQEADARYADRGRRNLVVLGRLHPGATVEAARAELDAIQTRLAVEFPEGNVYPDGSHFGAGANGLQAQTVGTSGRTLWLFLGAAVLLLLIAMLNAANLLLVRALDRREDLVVRAALGASRGRLMRETLAESLVLGVCAGAAGALLAVAGTAAFLHFGPRDLPRMAEVAVNPRVLLACTLLSILVGLVVGVLPALRLPPIATGLRAGARSLSRSGIRLRTALVSMQLAVALVLGIGASLLFHSFLRLRAVDPGFDAADTVTFSMGMKRPGAEAEPAWQGWDALLREIAAVPGVRAFGAASNLPFQSPNWAPAVIRTGGDPAHPLTGIAGYVVTPGYLDAAGTRVVAGRGITEADGPDAAPVLLVNEAFVQAFLPEEDPLGTALHFTEGGELGRSPRIVGVVENVVQARAEDGWLPAVYVPHTQVDWPVAHVLVRSDRATADITPDLRQAARRFSSFLPPMGLMTMETRVARVQTAPRFHALLFVSFAGVAILLAGIGLYGTLAHSVGRRRREIGIRMALGAEHRRIFTLVLRQGLTVGLVGAGLGLAGALSVSGLLRRYLFEVRPLDAPTFAFAIAVLGVVTALAALRPALRAVRVDVNRSLRSE